MEARAPYHAPAPFVPRNLAGPLAAWLRTQGFTALEYCEGTTVVAHWVGPRGEHFQLDYVWVTAPLPQATCRLRVLYAGQALFDSLFTEQRVRRLREARQLLLGNVRYANARLLATRTPSPAGL